MAEARYNTVINHPIDGEMHFRASVIDGTAISLADFLTDKVGTHQTLETRCIIMFIHEFYKILSVSVQTNNEEQLTTELNKVWSMVEEAIKRNN